LLSCQYRIALLHHEIIQIDVVKDDSNDSTTAMIAGFIGALFGLCVMLSFWQMWVCSRNRRGYVIFCLSLSFSLSLSLSFIVGIIDYMNNSKYVRVDPNATNTTETGVDMDVLEIGGGQAHTQPAPPAKRSVGAQVKAALGISTQPTPLGQRDIGIQ
jgi:hypothetical protein